MEGVKLKLPPEVLEFFRKTGAKGGKIGGKRSLETMTPEERTARAKNAVTAREAKRAATKKPTKRTKRAK
jgi:hypothetical protein